MKRPVFVTFFGALVIRNFINFNPLVVSEANTCVYLLRCSSSDLRKTDREHWRHLEGLALCQLLLSLVQ